jgi:stage II sporulation protein AA (anti-sigma F factor antagonist)
LDELHEAGIRHVAVDWREVTFFDSSAISVLVGAHLDLREAGGRFAVVRKGGGADRLFEIMGLNQVLTLVESITDLD